MLNSVLMRRISATVLVTFSSLTMQPLQAALQSPKVEHYKPGAATPDEKFSLALADTHELLKQLAPASAMPAAIGGKQKDVRAIGPNMKIVVEEGIQPMPGVNVAAKMKELRAKLAEIEEYSKAAEASFSEIEKHIKDKKLPAEILSRHEVAVKEYEARKTQFESLSQAVIAADDTKSKALPASLAALGAFFAKYPNEKTHTPTDPNKLPWGTPDGKVRKPYESTTGFKTSLFKEPRVLLAGPIPNGFTLPTANLPATPVAADLAPTEDVQITTAIQALADSLNNSPVKIYNWVRNNIEFLPTYGSIQGADMTLQTKRGNSFDTASLLIGLLRASGIPARYAYGTIEVPMDKAMNWVGGVTNPDAALNLLGQGGIPNIGVIAGGTFRSVKLEHVWVEAWVDYVPSRGAVNKVGDTWVKMDASFKQYKYTEGMDLKVAVPLDVNALVTQAQQGATINQNEGWVQNGNQSVVQSTLTNYQTRIQTYISTTTPNATIGDLLGTKTIQVQNYSILLGTLPYKTIAIGGKFNVLPDVVRHKFRLNLYGSALDRALDSPIFSFDQSLPKLANKKITLSFSPATQVDIDFINSFLPKPHADGTPIQPGELPLNLPGYLIHVKAELRVDGQLIVSGGNFTMGQELIKNMGVFSPAQGWQYGDDKIPTAGDFLGVGIDVAGIPRAFLLANQKILKTVSNSIAMTPDAPIDRDQLYGTLLHGTAIAYFAMLDGLDKVAQRQSHVISYRLPSFGTFEATLRTNYWFGIPRSVQPSGFVTDIDRSAVTAASKNNDQISARNFILAQGASASFMENGVPEMIYGTPNIPVNGVSAMKLLNVAAQNGIKIYHLTQSNVALILPSLSISNDVKIEITNAVAAGMEITLPAQNLTVGNWTGIGYVIYDPITGSGAYKLSGGLNGGVLDALGWIITAIATQFSYNSHLLNLGKVLEDAIGAWTGIAGYAIDFIDIADKCQGEAFTDTIVLYTLAFEISLAVLFLLGPFFWLALLAGLILFMVIGSIKENLIKTNCG